MRADRGRSVFRKKRSIPSNSGGQDAPLDFAAALLRDIADTLVQPDEGATMAAQEQFERWALHVLIQTLPPGRDDDDPLPAGERDYKGARQFARQTLKKQNTRLTTTLEGFRGVIDTFAERFSLSLREDIRSDRTAHAALTSLKNAAHGDDVAVLREAALGAVSQISAVLEDKRKNQRELVNAVANQMRPLREQIEAQHTAPQLDAESETLVREGVLLAAKVAEEAMALFLEPSVVAVVVVDPRSPAKAVADGLRRVFPRRRDFIGRLDAVTFAVISRDCDARDQHRIEERLRSRVPGIVRLGTAVTLEDDVPPAFERAQALSQEASAALGKSAAA